jgi:predicted ATPase
LARQLGRRLADVLRESAPTWLLQMPALLSADDRISLRGEDPQTARPRMLREITDALEALSRELPVVLVLEDLQWSDPLTIDLLCALGRRRSPARLLVIGTYRPADAARLAPRLLTGQAELQIHHECEVLPLRPLSLREAHERLSAICDQPLSAADADEICRRGGGNPLFLSAIVEGSRRATGFDVQRIVPKTLREMFEQQTAELTDREREMLGQAAVAGEIFSIAGVAKVLQWDETETETLCDSLARRHGLLKPVAADEVETDRYAFVHVLFREAIVADAPAGWRKSTQTETARLEAKGVVQGSVLVTPSTSSRRVAGRAA